MQELKLPPSFINEIEPHRLFFTWDITYKCNYQCSYCSLGGHEEKDKKPKTVYLSSEEWYKIWKGIYKRYGSCEIHATGGEPFFYPNFLEIITKLIEIHTFECSTNFYWEVDEFIKRIPSDRARIGTSFHPEFGKFSDFLNKALKLKKAGYEVWINYVAYPPLLNDIENALYLAQKEGISMSVLPFNGRYKDKDYPADYSEREKELLNRLGLNSIVIRNAFNWSLNKDARVKNKKFCRMGQMYGKIHPDGNVYRCCGKNSHLLGNLIEGTFSLLEEPLPCENEECPCWRSMVVGEEDRWASHWVTPSAARIS